MKNPASRNVSVAVMLLALAACSTDTPTAPEGTPAPPPGSSPSTVWNITLSAEPRSLNASAEQPATITVQVRRASDGSAPQNGTTVVVSAGLGDFNSAASGEKVVVVSLSGGAAQVLYFAGTLLGTDTVQAQLENSVGSASVRILEAAVLFIQSVVPSVGPENGGTRIRISGTGFSEPARVELGSGAQLINATVDAVGSDSEGEFVRAFTGPVFDDETFFDTETCDSDGDGTADGTRMVSTTVDVRVIFTDGNATLANAFTYIPDNRDCEGAPQPDRPSANFSFTKSGLNVQFHNESTPGSGLTFTWTFGDDSGFNSSSDPTHLYAVPGTYDVTLRAENSSGSSTRTKKVTVP